MLATLRPVDSCNRATLQIRTLEGRSGDLRICIIPKLYPKTAQVRPWVPWVPTDRPPHPHTRSRVTRADRHDTDQAVVAAREGAVPAAVQVRHEQHPIPRVVHAGPGTGGTRGR